MTFEHLHRHIPFFLHFRLSTDPLGDLMLKNAANNAFFGREDESRAVDLQRSLFNPRPVIKSKSFCIVSKFM